MENTYYILHCTEVSYIIMALHLLNVSNLDQHAFFFFLQFA